MHLPACTLCPGAADGSFFTPLQVPQIQSLHTTLWRMLSSGDKHKIMSVGYQIKQNFKSSSWKLVQKSESGNLKVDRKLILLPASAWTLPKKIDQVEPVQPNFAEIIFWEFWGNLTHSKKIGLSRLNPILKKDKWVEPDQPELFRQQSGLAGSTWFEQNNWGRVGLTQFFSAHASLPFKASLLSVWPS